MMQGRDHALPEDVQAVLPGIAGHRLQAASGMEHAGDVSAHLLNAVAIP